MSNKIANPPFISKNKNAKRQLTEEELARLQSKFVEPVQTSSRRRLKKFSEVNPDEEILPRSDQEDNQTEKLDELDQYKQFDLKDDDDIKKQLQQQKGAKKSKKLKGNQEIDKFIQKTAKYTVKEVKEQKPKVETKQLTLLEMMRIKKQKKIKRKSSDQFMVSDNGSISEEINEEELQAKRLAAYQKYNGSAIDQKQLIQRAMKLSLAATSAKNNKIDPNHQIGKPLKPLVSKEKSKLNKSLAKQEGTKKQTKARNKSAVKQPKQGPLSGLIIVFTGQFQVCTKEELIEVCEQLGAECPKSLTKKCKMLIQGSYVLDHFKRRNGQLVTQTAKSVEAKQRGLQIISYQEINNFFMGRTGFGLQHHLDNKVKITPINFVYKMEEEEQNKMSNISQDKPEKMQNERTEPINTNHNKVKPETMMQIQHPEIRPLGKDNRLWTQKYKPQRLEEVIGENSQIKALREWLESWEDIHIKGNKREIKQAKGWNSGSINSKAALISGDPGIGKTTTARLLAAHYFYSVSQFNASDIRNKSGVNLMETGSYNIDQSKNLNKSLIIMDQVDGMSSGDRGGITAIIALIKASKVPIICICNDRQSQKIRSLANHCLDVKFFKPHKGMVVQKLRSILVAQGGSGQDRALEQLIEAFQNDMRQILSYLEVIFKTVTKKITLEALSSKNKHSKDSSVMINHFDAARKLLNRTEFCRMKIQERIQCFFVDSDMVPLMVHENILNSVKKTKFSVNEFHSVVEGLKGMVIGDLLDKNIRKEQEWELMPSFGFMTCVYATEKMSQSVGFPSFPSWLGKFSSQRKVKRLAKEFKDYTYTQTLCSNWKAVKYLYVPLIIAELIQFLKQENIQGAIQFMQTYNITPAIISDHLTCLNFSTDKANPLAQISSSVKSRLTRTFNKRHDDAKLKNKKANKGKEQVMHYNAVLEQGQNQIEEQQGEQEQKQQSEVVVAKGKAKAPKKK